ncbi:MAG: cobalamin-binding protein [Dehalococcoidia bacterium]|nr:cobalamin-binding protein [Dehalococcoidia bacterium]
MKLHSITAGIRIKRKLWRLATLSLVSAILASLIVACASSVEEAPTFLLEVTDQAGRVVKLEKIPERIVSLAPSNTEVLFALGLGDKVVGVTEFCNYPEAAKAKPKIGGYSTVDLERTVAIEPDLILATNIHKDEIIPVLERLGLTVLTLDPKTLDEVLEAITLTGKCTGKQEAASQLVAEMRNRIKAVTDKTDTLSEAQRPRVFYVMWHEPLRTVSSHTRIHELIGLAGGVNIAQDVGEGYPTISLEAVIQANPQIIIAGSGMGEGADLPFQFVNTESRLKDTDARINHRLYEIYTDLVGRPGPRFVEALEQLAEMIHPELFTSD